MNLQKTVEMVKFIESKKEQGIIFFQKSDFFNIDEDLLEMELEHLGINIETIFYIDRIKIKIK